MELYPAIDIRGGGAVRLTQGDFGRERAYGDPLDLAERFIAGGATWLHVVDLDAARQGHPVNRATVLSIAGLAQSSGVAVQTGGGIRSAQDVDELLAGGVRRVVLGTMALEDPQLVRHSAGRYPGQVAVGIDYRTRVDGVTEVAVRGWAEGSGRTVADTLAQMEDTGVASVIVTAIERDGMLTGPDLDGLRSVLGATRLPVIASGGVASVDDLEALAAVVVDPEPTSDGGEAGPVRRLAGAITGKALVEGRISVEQGVAACARYG
jgi:phosphoribosylformimino-5-aminoimidazole carboxamide ribotide isomerase